MDADDARVLGSVADRLDALAEMAELMGDDHGASRYRDAAADRRREAFDLLDGD